MLNYAATLYHKVWGHKEDPFIRNSASKLPKSKSSGPPWFPEVSLKENVTETPLV